MQKYIYISITFCIFLFFHLIFFIYNKDYNFFIRSLKNGDNFDLKIINITDEYKIRNNDCNCEDICKENKNVNLQINNNEINNQFIEDEIEEIKEEEKIQNLNDFEENLINDINYNVILYEYKSILDNFKNYELSEPFYEEYYKLFGITYGYEKKYIILKSMNFELYLFFEDNYENISKNFFENLKYLGYKLNYVDIFGEKSFFINLDKDDGYVRIIIENNGKIFGIKLLREYYGEIRNILEKF